MSTWFITGASRGFGAEIVGGLLTRGHQVVATARRAEAVTNAFPDAGDQLLALPLDVTREDQAASAVAAAVERFGRIDVLVNNAGRGLLGAVEEASDAEIRAIYDTNVFGLLTITRAVAPVLRAQRSGQVVNITSVGGFAGAPGWGIYCSTKFAVEGFSEALADELQPLGVGVTIVEPGYFRTDFLDSSSLHTATQAIDDYADGPSGAMRSLAGDINHAQPGDPEKAAKAIIDTIESGQAPLRLQLGTDCVKAVESKLASVRVELDAWRAVAESTNHADVLL